MNRNVTCVAIALACAGSSRAQPHPEAGPGPMERVEFLIGRWEGEGRFMRGPQAPPQVVEVTEHVYPKLGGRVVLLEGRGTVPGREGGAPVTVHDALGVLSYDRTQEVFRMRAFKGSDFTDATVEVGDRRLVWELVVPQQGRVRYTLSLDESGRWHEIGELERGPEAWVRFFEMTLTRVGQA